NCVTTLGRLPSTPCDVVNALTKSARALPERSRTSFVTITDTTLEAGSPADRTIVRLSSEREMLGRTMSPLTNSANVLLFTVEASRDSENVITIGVPGATSTRPSFGTTEMICGAVVSVPAPVVNVRLKLLLVLPARSVTPFTETKIVLLPGNGCTGVNVTTLPLTFRLPATSPLKPEIVTWIPPASVVTSMGSLNVSTMGVDTGTLVAPCAGVAVTVGRTVSVVALVDVVKPEVKLLSVLPARSQTPCRRTVYAVFAVKAAVGVNVRANRSL